jgi:hypothetical protein
MQAIRQRLRPVAAATLLAFTHLTFGAPLAQAGMVSTEDALAPAGARARVVAALAREDVQARLVAQGVDPALVEARVAALSDAEARQLAAELDALPAGGDLIGALVFVFLVLLITDIAGLTDVFPFVKKRR